MQALGLIETKGLIAAIESADAMLKAANVNLLEKTLVGGGLVSITITGDVGAVKAAVEAGSAAVRNINGTLLVSEHVIPRPHEDLDFIILSDKTPSEESTEGIDQQDYEEIPVAAKEEMIESENEDAQKAPDEAEATKIEKVEEDTVGISDSKAVTTAMDTIAQNSESNHILMERTTVSPKFDLSKLHNKEAIDKLMLEAGIEETIKVLNGFRVVELRNLAREYKNFGITGRKVSKADKMLLIAEFRKYYGL